MICAPGPEYRSGLCYELNCLLASPGLHHLKETIKKPCLSTVYTHSTWFSTSPVLSHDEELSSVCFPLTSLSLVSPEGPLREVGSSKREVAESH